MTYKTISQTVVESLKGGSAREHKDWTFVVYKGKSYGFKGSLSQLKAHQGSFELTITIDEEGVEYGHIHLAETL